MKEKLRVENQARANSMKPGKWVKSTCKMCLHTCAIQCHITPEGVINKIEGDPTSPSNRGKGCTKQITGIMRTYDPYRITNPVKRTNPRKGPNEDPGWVEISWEEAMTTVAEKVKECMEKDPRSFIANVNDFQRPHNMAWTACVGSSNQMHVVGTYCGGAYHITAGIYNSCFAGVGDYKYCNYWLQIGGGDGFSSHLHLGAAQGYMADARARGMRVVCVEPRLSTSASKAEEWVPIRPATDRHFVLGMIHALMYEHKIWDAEYLKWYANGGYLIRDNGFFKRSGTEKHTAPQGRPASDFRGWWHQTQGERYKPMIWDPVDQKAKVFDDPTIKDIALEGSYEVEGEVVRPAFQFTKDRYKEYTPEWAEKVTTVPAATIRRIAKEFGEAAQIGSSITIGDEVYPFRPVSANWYRGAQAHKGGCMDNQVFILLNMLVGAYNVPGGMTGVVIGSPTMSWTDEPGLDGLIDPKPHQLHPDVPFAWPPNTVQVVELFPIGVDAGQMCAETLMEPDKWGIGFKPRVLMLNHSNCLWSLPGNVEIWYEIMRKFEFIFAIEIFVNESCQFADIILPDKSYLESWALCMCEPPFVEGLNCRQPVVKEPGTCRESYDILADLAERIGKLDIMNGVYAYLNGLVTDPDIMYDPTKRYTHEQFLDRCARLWTKQVQPPEKNLEWFKEHGHNCVKRPPEHMYLVSDKRGRDMRRPFYCETFLNVRDDLQNKLKEAGAKLPVSWNWGEYGAIPDGQLSPVHTEPAEYDMYAITFKEHFMNFTENLSIPWVRELVDRDPHHRGLMINPIAAKARGIENGDYIEVRSRFGYLTGWAVLSEGVHHETIGVSNATNRTVTHSPITRMGGGQFNTLLGVGADWTCAVSGAMESVAKVKVKKIPAPPPPPRY
jgi:anaerobic selenocysteine-containing dehydrogenase